MKGTTFEACGGVIAAGRKKKRPVPPEGTGHSQGERRLLVTSSVWIEQWAETRLPEGTRSEASD
ncbi:hypothetical protein [Tautonia marina]|uniref:hypothetical protein n=1 Tax=Tautonia marina TaxID=2653855 RepID=UPI00137612D2|nr:hypothetical protein [Tautonia marina]